MNIVIDEIWTTPNSTASMLFVDNRPIGFIIEDGHRDNKVPGETRIPAGRYPVVKRTYGKFFDKYRKDFGHKYSIEVKDVPGFDDILIHIGNTIKDTRGCPLINRGVKQDATGDFAGIDSTSIYKLFYRLVDLAFERGEEVWCEVIRREIFNKNAFG